MIKKSIKSYLYKRGYYLRTVDKNIDELKWILNHHISTIIDVGSHKGESYALFRKILPAANYIGFEPIDDCYAQLKKNTSGDKNAQVFQFAVSDTDGTSTFYLTDQSHCSSLLKPEQSTEEYAGNHIEQQVELRKLDTLLEKQTLEKNILVKIDVQGAEEKVLRGARKVLTQATVVIIEISFAPLYKDQPDFHSIYSFMTELGYKYTGAFDQFTQQTTGRVMQQDAIFVRP